MDKVRTAVVGAGKMGAIHAKVYDSLPQSELAAVVDVAEDKACKLASRYNCSAATRRRGYDSHSNGNTSGFGKNIH